MSQDILHFQCNACQAPLTVPVHLAGVTGPCPKCGATVTSPPAPAPAQEPLAVPPMPPMPSMQAPPMHQIPTMMPPAMQQIPSMPPPPMQQMPAMMPPAMQQVPPLMPPLAHQSPLMPPAMPQIPAMTPPPVQQSPLMPSMLPAMQQVPEMTAPPMQQSPLMPQPAQQPVETIAPQFSNPPQQPPRAPGGWGTPEIPQAQHVAPAPSAQPPHPEHAELPAAAPTPTMLPPRRQPGQAPGAASLMTQPGPGAAAPVVSGLAHPSPAPQWNLSGAAEPPQPMPKREIEDPIATILRGTGAPPNSEAESQPRQAASPLAAMPAPVSMPRQTMNLKLGGGPKRGGKMIATLAAVLLIGALGAAAWFFQEPIKEMAGQLFPKKASNAPGSPSIPATGEPSAAVAAAASAPLTPGGSAPFDPLSKPAPGLKGGEPATGIGPNAVVGTNLPVPPNPGAPPSAPGSTSPPSSSSEEIKPPSAADTAASLAPLLPAPKATVVEDGTESPAPQTAQHVPGTALGKKGGGTDSLIEVTPNNPAVPAPTSNGRKSSASDTKKEVVVQVTPEAKRAADALQAFFAAGNLSERMPLTLGAANMKSLMERYYAKKDSGPIEVSEIKLLRHDPVPGTGGGAHCVFTVASKLWEYPIPVMLQEEGGAYKVDWLAFVEFRDNLLFEFLSDFQEMPARFHVGIRRTHYFEDDVPDLDGKDCFEIQPPLPSYVGYVFLPKESPLAADLASRISWETLTAYVIVELRWKRLGPMKWVELTAVPQLNWYSFPQPAQSDSSLESKASPAKKGAGGVDVKQRIPTGPPQK